MSRRLAPEIEEAIVQAPPLKAYQGLPLKEFLSARGWLRNFQQASDLLEIDFDAAITSIKQEFDRSILRELTVICSGDEAQGNGIKTKVDSKTGQLLYYFNYVSRTIPKMQEEALLTQEEALKVALHFKEELGREGRSDEVSIYKAPGEWEVSFERYFNGHRCQSRTLSLSVSLNGGEILYFQDKPPIHPERLVEIISKEEAVEMAIPFLIGITGKRQEEITIRSVDQTISLTTGPWTKEGPQPLEGSGEMYPASRLVWDIGYETSEHDAFWVLIDCETGERYAPYIGM